MLTHCGLMTPYGDTNPGQHWLRKWLVAWRHQAITWTNVDLSSVRSSGIHLSAILHEMPQPSVTEISLKITYLNFCSNLPGTNDNSLRPSGAIWLYGTWSSLVKGMACCLTAPSHYLNQCPLIDNKIRRNNFSETWIKIQICSFQKMH